MEQAVIVCLQLDNASFGSTTKREALSVLQERLAGAIVEAGAGEFDGDEIGKGECLLFMYGPDADRLFNIIEPLLKSSAVASGGHAIKLYGKADDPNTREVRVTW
jgi:hypothetical protein